METDLTERVRAICLALPEVNERPSHSAPTFWVRDKKSFLMLWAGGHHQNGFPHLWCAAPPGEQAELIAAEPDRFFRPPYVGGRGWIGVRLDGEVDWAQIAEVCQEAYRVIAPARLIAQLDGDLAELRDYHVRYMHTRSNMIAIERGSDDSRRRHMIKTAKLRRDGLIRVTFTLPTSEPAGPVSVVGDFNGWNPLAHPLRRRANKVRSATITVPAGSTFRFRYLADGGQWFDDETIVADGRDAVIAV